jgi:hypothetical protein
MIPIGQPYRPAGTLDVRSILITLILGTTAAVIGAAIVWLWEWSPIPTLVILTPIIQGVGIGLVMAFVVERLRMRNPKLIGTVGFACGLLSILLVHYGHYLHLVTAVADQVRTELAQDKSIPEAQRSEILARLGEDPAAFVNPLLKMKTGHSGFIGSLILRNEQGVRLKNSPVSGTFLWILWGAEAFLVAAVAAALPASRAGQPFCEECGYWCVKQPDLFTLPGVSAAPLAEAIREDNPARVMELRASPPPYDQTGLVGVTLHACPGCDQSFAEVSHRVSSGNQTKVVNLLKLHRVSPEMAAAFRATPPSAGATEEAPGEEPGHEDIAEERRVEDLANEQPQQT